MLFSIIDGKSSKTIDNGETELIFDIELFREVWDELFSKFCANIHHIEILDELFNHLIISLNICS